MRPFLKWAGGKYRLVERIISKLPPANRLIEPFAGSCALSLNANYNEYLINDINQDLVNLYLTLQEHGNKFIKYCKRFFKDENNTSEKYYKMREKFNKEKYIFKRSAMMVYFNRHGYNGLCRFNSQGQFNVPFGRYKRPYFPETEMKHFYEKFKTADFICKDFEEVMMKAKRNDVIYCDPPYIPLNSTSNFTEYSPGGFDIQDQERLAKTAKKLAKKGIITVISNHWGDEIIKLYDGAYMEEFSVRRFISCNASKRNAVTEILAVFN